MSEMVSPQECRVALLAGGTSGERKISLASGNGAREALESVGFDVTFIDPSNKADLKKLIDEQFDVAFLCMHGKNGEDGTIQGFLEVLGIPYTGSGVWSSALAMDKVKSKTYYRQAGIPTPTSILCDAASCDDVESILRAVGQKCVVKPVAEGSALGVSIVEGPDQLHDALSQLVFQGGSAMVETYIAGTELTVAVLGNEDPDALPVIEIIPQNSFYDFESKYAPGGSQHICPARISCEATKKVQDYAVRAHRALECAGMSRSDFILDETGEGWILETNTIPGMTATSLLPDAANAAGIAFPDLCRKIIELALEKN